MGDTERYAVLVDKLAVLEALEEAREDVADDYGRGHVGPDAALRQLIRLYEVTERIHGLERWTVKHDCVSRETEDVEWVRLT